MSNPIPGQPGRPRDYVVIDGLLWHKRWLNPDGSRKTGKALEEETLRAEMDAIAKRLLACPNSAPQS